MYGYYDTHQPLQGTYRPITEETERLMTPEEEALVDQLIEEDRLQEAAWDSAISATLEAFLKSGDLKDALEMGISEDEFFALCFGNEEAELADQLRQSLQGA